MLSVKQLVPWWHDHSWLFASRFWSEFFTYFAPKGQKRKNQWSHDFFYFWRWVILFSLLLPNEGFGLHWSVSLEHSYGVLHSSILVLFNQRQTCTAVLEMQISSGQLIKGIYLEFLNIPDVKKDQCHSIWHVSSTTEKYHHMPTFLLLNLFALCRLHSCTVWEMFTWQLFCEIGAFCWSRSFSISPFSVLHLPIWHFLLPPDKCLLFLLPGLS